MLSKSIDPSTFVNIMIYVYISKTFYTVPHRKQVHNLTNCGVTWNILQWFRSFLYDHYLMLLSHSGEYPCECKHLIFAAYSPKVITSTRRISETSEALHMVTNACEFLTKWNPCEFHTKPTIT